MSESSASKGDCHVEDWFLITRYLNSRGTKICKLYGPYASREIAEQVQQELTAGLTSEDMTRSEFDITTASYPSRKRR